MDNLVPAEVLKVFQTIVLPLELKINTLLDVVRALETKIEVLTAAQTATKEGKPKIPQADTPNARARQQATTSYATAVSVATGLRTPTTTQRNEPKVVEARTVPVARPVTRRQRAAAAATSAQEPAATRSHQHRTQIAPSLVSAPNVVKDTVESCSEASGPSTADAVEVTALDSQQWRAVRGRQRKPPVRGAGDLDTDLATVEKTRQIHVWSLRSDVTVDQVKSYMAKKCATGAPYTVEKLQLRHTNYASFVVTVPESLFDFFMSAKSWPQHAEINEWFRRHRRSKENTSRPNTNDAASS